jgi:MFS family permease
VAGALFASVTVRGVVAGVLAGEWRGSVAAGLALAISACCGKCLGGWLADRYGWRVSAVTALVMSSPLMILGMEYLPLAIIGMLLFQSTIGEWHSAQLRLALLPASQPPSVLTNVVNCLELSLTESTNNRFVANLALTSDHVTRNLTSLDESSPLGTWSLTLESDRASLRGPSGSETRAGIPSEVLSAFADPLFVYCYAPEQTWESWWGRGNYQPPADVTIKRIRIQQFSF